MKTLGMLFIAALLVSLAPAGAPAAQRDGSAGFDFLLGRWHTHYRILRHRLVHDTVWYSCNGESNVTPFWEHAGNIEVGSIACPPPRGLSEGMTLRWYNTATKQWSLWWGTKKLGLAEPPQIGGFQPDGTGVFFANDTYNGRRVKIRYRWSLVKGLPHFEQAFSTDGGATWETNWTTDYTRAST